MIVDRKTEIQQIVQRKIDFGMSFYDGHYMLRAGIATDTLMELINKLYEMELLLDEFQIPYTKYKGV